MRLAPRATQLADRRGPPGRRRSQRKEQELREQVARETLEIVLNDLRDGAEIEIVSQNDEPTGAAAPAPAAVDFKLAGKAGRDAGLAADDRVKAFVAKAEEQAVRELYLEREIEARINDELIQEAYQVHLADNPPAEELHARHILVETEEEAREVIALLDGGADFAELAKERSTGPSGPKGGDLGYFTADQMVPEFSEAAAALEPGSYTKEPAKTQFGWHVIKLEDRRTAAPPPFEEIEQQLREQVARETLEIVLNDLRDGAEIEIVSQNDEPTGAAAPAPAAVQ